MKREFLITFIFLILPGIVSAYPNYKTAEKHLQETWENSFPISYSKIVKVNPTSKGILEIRDKKKRLYLYTFIVFVPRYTLEDKSLIALEEGKEVFVKLYFDPNNSEIPYSIKLGEFEEKYFSKSRIRWIGK
ncbi:MAG: hypothetical protein L6Q54_06020 [Leptospiraceae bacterium]|nr:hypothetical protein [Leptospiraceae bacterium]MCK6380792.1 hypothetical protein [Leptospiraceae bacterium]NUM40491.1 hypothetical protein [Leptospiraceae bacterium]